MANIFDDIHATQTDPVASAGNVFDQMARSEPKGPSGPEFAGNPKSPSEVSAFLKNRYPDAYKEQPSVTRQVLTGAAKGLGADAYQAVKGASAVLPQYLPTDQPSELTKSVDAATAPNGPGEEAGKLLEKAVWAVPMASAIRTGLSKVGDFVSHVPGLERLTPTNLYGGSLRPFPSVAPVNRAALIKTGIQEGIPVTESGLSKLQSTNEALNNQVKGLINAKSGELGAVIEPTDAAKPVAETRTLFGTQVNPETDVNAIDKARAEFLAKHTSSAPYTKIEPMVEEGPGYYPTGEGVTKTEVPLTLNEAQAEKQGTYRMLSGKYGELSSADTEAQKALARGLKSEIEARVPEVGPLNAREGRLIDLEEPLSRSINREGNRQLLGLRVPFDTPTIKSNMAIGMDRFGKVMTKPLSELFGGGTGQVPASLQGPATIMPPPNPAPSGNPAASSMPPAAPPSVPMASPGSPDILSATRSLAPSEGVPVTAMRMRATMPGVSKQAFDQAALAARARQEVWLTKHHDPHSLSPEDLSQLIDEGNGKFHVSIAERTTQ